MLANASKKVSIFNKLKFKLSRNVLEIIYKSFIRPTLEYGDIIWHGCTISDSQLIERIQYECSLVVSGAIRGSSYLSILKELGWEKLSDRRHVHSLILFYKIIQGLTRPYLRELIPPFVLDSTHYDLRNKQNIQIPICATDRFKRSFIPYATYHWNKLTLADRSLSLPLFRKNCPNLCAPSLFRTSRQVPVTPALYSHVFVLEPIV